MSLLRLSTILRSALMLLLLSSGCMRTPSTLTPARDAAMAAAPDSFLVEFVTTKGTFTVKAHRAWSPLGVDRLYEVAALHLYSGVPVFRVIPGKLVQFGLTGDSAVDAAWENRGIPDEPVLTANVRGKVSFARAGARTRSSQIFINLRNNSPRYDTLNAQGVIGYPPVAEVIDGLSVLDSLNGTYGNAPSEFQDSISAKGIGWLDAKFPGLDRIIRTRVKTY